MKSRIITFTEKDLWNDFVASTEQCPILQSFEWGEFKSCFGWQPIRIAIEEEGKIMAGVSLLKREIPYLRHSIFYAPRGPLLDFRNREVFHYLLEIMEKEAEKRGAISLKIDPEVLEGEGEILGNLKAFGFVKALKQIQPRATFIIDLQRDLEEILMSFEEKTRYNIRLAERRGVEVLEDSSQKGINIFYEMYKNTAKKDKFLIHPLIYYQKIGEILFTAGLGTNFMAYYDHQPIAALIVFSLGKKVWYLYGASNYQYRNLMANQLLHWEVIKWAKERNFKFYDLGGIPVNPREDHPLWGIYRFKKGFRGKLIKFIGAYDFPYSPLFYHLFEHSLVWWQNLRSLITKGKIEDSLAE